MNVLDIVRFKYILYIYHISYDIIHMYLIFDIIYGKSLRNLLRLLKGLYNQSSALVLKKERKQWKL